VQAGVRDAVVVHATVHSDPGVIGRLCTAVWTELVDDSGVSGTDEAVATDETAATDVATDACRTTPPARLTERRRGL
jgi:hypothetical protein